MMYLQHYFPYTKGRGCQVLELHYCGRAFSMLIILPRAGGLEEAEDSLTAGTLKDFVGVLGTREVQVEIPRLGLEQTCSLRETLENLGASTLFTERADLSGITDDPLGLSVSDVIHRAIVTMDESGTEAAAATAVLMPLGCAPTLPELPAVFRADHPYLFLILGRKTGIVLFLGRVVNPQEAFGGI